MTQPSSDLPRYATLRDYLTILRRQRVVVVVVALLGAGVALLISARQDPVYRAEASLAFREPTQDIELIGLPPIRYNSPEQRAALGAEQAQRREVVEETRRRLRSPVRVDTLQGQVSARQEVNTNLVVVEGEASTGQAAARLTNTVAEVTRDIVTRDQQDRYTQLIRKVNAERRKVLKGRGRVSREERRQLQAQLIPVRTARDLTRPVQIVESASVPGTPVSPRPVRNTVIGGIIGLILAMIIVALRTALDRRLRGTGEVAEVTDKPVLAMVRDEALGRVNTGSVDGKDEDAELDLEAFRVLRTNLDYLHIDTRVRTVLVTSPLAQEGKSTVASSLAVAQALAGKRTLLVECDLRRPVLAARCGLEPTPGLTDYLAGHAQPQEIVRVLTLPVPSANGNGDGPANEPGVAVITAGTRAARPAEMLGSEKFAAFLAQVNEVYDVVILDTPPLLPVGDALELVHAVDAIIVCVRSHQTTRDDLRSALRALERLPERPTGIVMTGLRKLDESYAYYYGSYAYTPGTGA